jgi:hypothetical protein
VQFRGAAANQLYSSTNILISQPITLSAVVNYTVAPNGLMLSDHSFNFQFAGTGPSIRMYAGTSQDTAVTVNSHILQAVYNSGGQSSLTMDATLNNKASPGSAGLGTVGANTLALGSAGTSTANITAAISEIGGWGLAFTTGGSSQAINMCNNQYLYWGTSTSC